MATIFVNPGLNQIQAALNSASASVDEVVMRDGTYTFNTTSAMDFRSVITGKIFTKITVRAQNAGKAIVDVGGCVGDAFVPGNSSGVTMADFVLQGTPAGVMINEIAGAANTWTWQNIQCGAMNKIPFLLISNLGLSMVFDTIVSLPAFNAPRLLELGAMTSGVDKDLLIKNIDARLHTPNSMLTAVQLLNLWDGRLRGLKTKDTTMWGFKINTTDVTNGTLRVDVMDVEVDGTGAGVPGIHSGNTDILVPTKKVRIYNADVRNTGAYGIEFENGAEDCSLLFSRTTNTIQIGIALAEDTKDILVAHNVVDGVSSFTNSGECIAMVNNQRHQVIHNVLRGARYGIRHVTSGGFATSNRRNTVKDNIIFDVSFAYRVFPSAGDYPATSVSQMFGPNVVVTPSEGFAAVDDSASTKAQYETAINKSKDESDILVATVADMKFVDVAGKDFRTYTSSPAYPIRAGIGFTREYVDVGPKRLFLVEATSRCRTIFDRVTGIVINAAPGSTNAEIFASAVSRCRSVGLAVPANYFDKITDISDLVGGSLKDSGDGYLLRGELSKVEG